MRLEDIALVDIPASYQAPALRGPWRLLRDLVAVGLMQDDSLSAYERLESKLGGAFARVLHGSLIGAEPDVHGGSASTHALQPREAA